jgi:sporulation protein YlmC with PRC-barrel domain
VLLGAISLLSLVCAVGAFAADRDLPWHLMKGSTFIGSDVENPQGQNLGDVKDVVIDRSSGRIAYAVVSFGGFLGMGEKLFAVPWGAFTQPKADKDTLVLDVDKERLKNAPGFDTHNWPQMASQEWVTSLYSYYNVPPYWTASAEAPMTTATVKNVDPNQRTITLQVDGRMLQNLQAGDSTQVTIRKSTSAK